MARIKYICGECGGSNVSSNATVTWSIDKQEWEAGDNLEGDFCSDCDQEVGLDFIEIENVGTITIDTTEGNDG